jgi:hypothetical protein
VRGTTAGKGYLAMDATTRVTCPVHAAYPASQRASHTLENRDCPHAGTLRAKHIDGTVEAISSGSEPRLVRTRSCS